MLKQALPPVEWIIVDDGSTDGTTEIIEAAAKEAKWIRMIRRTNRGYRKAGAGVVEAFYEGFEQVSFESWDLLVKLDGDLEFEPDYFQKVCEVFHADPRLGIAGGDIYHFESGRMVIESITDPSFHVRGANKTYRRQCWEEMNGLLKVTGWDTLDELNALMLGWNTRRLENARLLHLKPTGAADGTWKNAFKNGRGSFICGYHPLFLLARSARRVLHRPILVESTGLALGYFSARFAGVQQAPNPRLRQFIRRQQLLRLRGRPSIWQ